MIEFSCDVEEDTKNYINALLPQRKTKIVEVYASQLKNLTVRLYTDLRERKEATAWVKEFESITKGYYSIRNTVSTTGRFVKYKQAFICRHNTRTRLKDVSENSRTKNTECPARITITLHAIGKKKYRGRNLVLYNLRKEMPCEIFLVFTHNHDLESIEALKHRKVSSELKERLLKLYFNGHSPKSALESIRKYICLHSDDPQTALADRAQCPSYTYCYYLYTKHFNKCKETSLNDAAMINNLVQKRLEDYNAETDGNSVQMIMHEADYVICICTPLMKRVHKYIKSASEVAFVDSSVHHGRCRVIVILTHNDCGGLPLAVIVMSSDNSEVISLGFQMMESMCGEDMFGGHPEGPKVFLTGDSQAEQAAVRGTWKGSQCYMSVTHLLQSVWAWLNKPKNNIPTERRVDYFDCFKSILHSTTIEGATQTYYAVQSNAYNDPNFLMYLDLYWQIKEQWVLAYRTDSHLNWDDTSNLSEVIMRVIKNKLFDQAKSFNVVQMVDYLLSTFVEYYEIRLLETAKNRLKNNILGKLIEPPSAEIFDKIKILDTNTVSVPCQTVDELYYTVNIDALRCTCSQGIWKGCQHIEWACMLLHSETFNTNIDNKLPRKMLYRIAMGKDPPSDWLSPLWSDDQCFNCCETSLVSESDNSTGENLNVDPYPQDQKETASVCLEKGQKAIRELSYILDKHLRKNLTNSVVEGLEKMCENAKRLCTASEFEAACSTFGQERQQKSNSAECPNQDQSTKKRKLNPSTQPIHVQDSQTLLDPNDNTKPRIAPKIPQLTNIQDNNILRGPINGQLIMSAINPNDNTNPCIAPNISYVLLQTPPMLILTGHNGSSNGIQNVETTANLKHINKQ